MNAKLLVRGLLLSCTLNLACGGPTPSEPAPPPPPPPPEPNRCVVTPVETGITSTIGQNLDLEAGGEGFAIAGKAVDKGGSRLLWYPLDAAGAATGDPVELKAKGKVGASSHADLVWTGTAWLALWDTSTKSDTPHYRGKARLARFGADGSPNGKTRAISDDRWDIDSPRLAWSAQGAGAVWSSSRDQEVFNLSFRPLTADGATAGPVVDLAEVPRLTSAAIAWDGNSFGVVWTAKVGNQRELHFARVSPTGEVEVPPVQLTRSGAGGDLDIVAVGGGYGVAYSVYSGGGRVHYLAISRDGVATGEPRQVNDGARAKSEYAMATDGTDIGLVWTDGSANESSQDDEHNHDLYFARLSAEGEILTPAQRVTETGGLSISVYLAWRDGAWVAGKEPSYKKPVQLQRLTRCDDPSSN